MPPTPTVRANGSRIRELRLAAGRSVIDLANAIHRHESTIRKVENEGDKGHSEVLIRQIATELGVDLPEIIQPTEPLAGTAAAVGHGS